MFAFKAICWYWPTLTISSAYSGRPNIWGMFWRLSRSRHGSAQTAGCTTARQEPLTNIGSRSKPPDRPKVDAVAKFVFLTPPAGTFCVPEEIWYFPILYSFLIFPAVFSQVHSLGRWLVLHSPIIISPNAPRSPLHPASTYILMYWM